jgi:hypothetical protein
VLFALSTACVSILSRAPAAVPPPVRATREA